MWEGEALRGKKKKKPCGCVFRMPLEKKSVKRKDNWKMKVLEGFCCWKQRRIILCCNMKNVSVVISCYDHRFKEKPVEGVMPTNCCSEFGVQIFSVYQN